MKEFSRSCGRVLLYDGSKGGASGPAERAEAAES